MLNYVLRISEMKPLETFAYSRLLAGSLIWEDLHMCLPSSRNLTISSMTTFLLVVLAVYFMVGLSKQNGLRLYSLTKR